MSRGAWLAVFAAGWLILGSALGQAQEEAQNARGDADQQQEPASYPPLPLPVEIVEDESTTQSRERREAETRKREIDDLIAQQGMNAATQRMTLATEDMRDYAYAQTWLIGIGTGLLLITLWLTRQANAAAQEAVKVTRDIGSTQLRA